VFFQAIGKAAPAFITAIARQVICLLPLILILPRHFGLDGVWISFPIADALAFGLTFTLFYFHKKKLDRLAISTEDIESVPKAGYSDRFPVDGMPEKINPGE
jgi:Na+-driven multidrug efflux pump